MRVEQFVPHSINTQVSIFSAEYWILTKLVGNESRVLSWVRYLSGTDTDYRVSGENYGNTEIVIYVFYKDSIAIVPCIMISPEIIFNFVFSKDHLQSLTNHQSQQSKSPVEL